MAPKYKLIYFDLKGRAELSRLLFAAAGVEYEDYRIKKEEWPSLKLSLPFGQVPVLEVGGKQYAQSFAIANYLANEFGLRGQNNEECLQIDQILEVIKDFHFYVTKFFKETDAEKKPQLMEEALTVHAVACLRLLEALLGKNSSGFFVGSQLSLADLAVFDITDWILDKSKDALSEFPQIQSLQEKVANMEKLKKYLDQRDQAK